MATRVSHPGGDDPEGSGIDAPDFSVVITCHFEEESIEEFHRRLSGALQELGRSFEIIFVNDGSTDATWECLKRIYGKDDHVTAIVDLFKNSGQAAAQTAGFAYAKGRAIVIIDSDLQLDPEELPTLVAKYDEGFDVVSGCRSVRKDSLARLIPSRLANHIMRVVSQSNLTDFGCTFKIFDAKLIRAFEFGPFNPWLAVNVIAKAERIAEVAVTHHPRKYGTSGWTFSKLWRFNSDNIVRLSDKPFQLLAFACILFAFLVVVRIGLSWFSDIQIAEIITNGLLLNALLIAFLVLAAILSIIGELVIRSFLALQHEPVYVAREVHTR